MRPINDAEIERSCTDIAHAIDVENVSKEVLDFLRLTVSSKNFRKFCFACFVSKVGLCFFVVLNLC